MRARRALLVMATAVASGCLWLAARDELTAVVGWLARSLVALAGHDAPVVPGDALAIVVARTADGVAVVRGTTLERWHVNVIALPALVVAFGAASWRRRTALGIAGAAVVLVADALCAIAFVALQGPVPAELQTPAMRVLAVYGSKLVPVLVAGVLITASRRAAVVEGT